MDRELKKLIKVTFVFALIIFSGFFIWYKYIIGPFKSKPINYTAPESVDPATRKFFNYHEATNSYDFKCTVLNVIAGSVYITDNTYYDLAAECEYRANTHSAIRFTIPLRLRFTNPNAQGNPNTFLFYGTDYINPLPEKAREYALNNLKLPGKEIRVNITSNPAAYNSAHPELTHSLLDKLISSWYRNYPDIITDLEIGVRPNYLIIPKTIIYESV